MAGKCGNPLCASLPGQAAASTSGGRYHISTSQQVVYDKAAAAEAQTIFCGEQCAGEVRRFAQRLGNGSLALERFSAMYQQLRQQGQQGQRQAQQKGAAGTGTGPHAAGAAEAASAAGGAVAAAEAAAAAATGPAEEEVHAAAGGPSAAGTSSSGSKDSDPGGIKSTTTLVPRLAVEQVEVKHIDSCAGQFADFSRKVAAKPQSVPGAAVAPAVPKPKGVLKKHSQFAAGTSKVPIMLAEVKVSQGAQAAAGCCRLAG